MQRGSRNLLAALVVLIGLGLWFAAATSPKTKDNAGQALRPEIGDTASASREFSKVRDVRRNIEETSFTPDRPAGAEPADTVESREPDARLATLVVRVVRGAESTAAEGVLVIVNPVAGEELLDHQASVTDALGLVRFEGLRAGEYSASVWRGDDEGFEQIDLTPGTIGELTIAIQGRLTIRGVVLDEFERPLGNAEVLVSNWIGEETRALERTDAQGRFVLRWMQSHVRVGARATGYASSPLVACVASPAAEIEISITLTQRACELRGIVYDPLGAVLTRALVQAGNAEQLPNEQLDGSAKIAARAVQAMTDTEGRFHFAHLGAGACPIEVAAREHAPHAEVLQLRTGEERFVAVHLQRGAVLFGVVRDERGAGVSEALVSIGAWGRLSHRSTRTLADGSYRLRGLASGAQRLTVRSTTHGSASSEVQLISGSELEHDVVLSKGLHLRGRVLDANGSPVARVMIDARTESRFVDAPWQGAAYTDASGRFLLKDLRRDRTLHLAFRRDSTFPELELREVQPKDAEIEVRLPPFHGVRLRGRVLDSDGAVPHQVRISVVNSESERSSAASADPTTGAFDLGPYPPGEYSVSIHAPGFAVLRIPARQLEPNEVWELGDLRLTK